MAKLLDKRIILIIKTMKNDYNIVIIRMTYGYIYILECMRCFALENAHSLSNQDDMYLLYTRVLFLTFT